MGVPFLDFSEQYALIKDEVDKNLKALFERGDYILGKDAKTFEEDFARYCEVSCGIGVNSGTDALYLALAAMDITEGDEVILPSFTFIATALCVSYTGARPVFIDVEDTTYNLDPDKLEDVITERTKAIIPVHIYGQSANMDEILSVAKKFDIRVAEDACQAHGARYKGRRVGSLGDIGCFSFYPTKSLGAFGDAGMIVTDDEVLAEKARMLRDYGRKDRYNHKVKGYNSRLDTAQAVILNAKLKYLDEWNKRRADNAAHYCSLLNETPEIRTPVVGDDRTHVYQTFAVRIPNRDRAVEKLRSEGIGALIHYPIPLHLQEAYQDMGHKAGDFPVSERLAREVLSLPMYPHMEKTQIESVCSALKKAIQ